MEPRFLYYALFPESTRPSVRPSTRPSVKIEAPGGGVINIPVRSRSNRLPLPLPLLPPLLKVVKKDPIKIEALPGDESRLKYLQERSLPKKTMIRAESPPIEFKPNVRNIKIPINAANGLFLYSDVSSRKTVLIS